MKKNLADKLHMNLYKAAQAYAKFYKGSVLVAGGVSVIQMPGDYKFNYRLVVSCTGIVPKFPKKPNAV